MTSDRPKDPALVAREPERVLALWRRHQRASLLAQGADPALADREIDELAAEVLAGLWKGRARTWDRLGHGDAGDALAVCDQIGAILEGAVSPVHALTLGVVETRCDGATWRLRVHTADGEASVTVEQRADDPDEDGPIELVEVAASAALVTHDAAELVCPDEVSPDAFERLVELWRTRARTQN